MRERSRTEEEENEWDRKNDEERNWKREREKESRKKETGGGGPEVNELTVVRFRSSYFFHSRIKMIKMRWERERENLFEDLFSVSHPFLPFSASSFTVWNQKLDGVRWFSLFRVKSNLRGEFEKRERVKIGLIRSLYRKLRERERVIYPRITSYFLVVFLIFFSLPPFFFPFQFLSLSLFRSISLSFTHYVLSQDRNWRMNLQQIQAYQSWLPSLLSPFKVLFLSSLNLSFSVSFLNCLFPYITVIMSQVVICRSLNKQYFSPPSTGFDTLIDQRQNVTSWEGKRSEGKRREGKEFCFHALQSLSLLHVKGSVLITFSSGEKKEALIFYTREKGECEKVSNDEREEVKRVRKWNEEEETQFVIPVPSESIREREKREERERRERDRRERVGILPGAICDELIVGETEPYHHPFLSLSLRLPLLFCSYIFRSNSCIFSYFSLPFMLFSIPKIC